MLNTNMYSLPHNSSVHLFVHLDTNHSFCDVLDNTSASMVELVRHTFVDGTIHLDVDIVTDSVGAKVGGEMDITFPPERASEEITDDMYEISVHVLQASLAIFFFFFCLRPLQHCLRTRI